MALPTHWRWVWVNSGSWWWTGRPVMLQSMGLQRVGHDWVTELNWTDAKTYDGMRGLLCVKVYISKVWGFWVLFECISQSWGLWSVCRYVPQDLSSLISLWVYVPRFKVALITLGVCSRVLWHIMDSYCWVKWLSSSSSIVGYEVSKPFLMVFLRWGLWSICVCIMVTEVFFFYLVSSAY